MKNYPVKTVNGDEVWIHRSIAVVTFVFSKVKGEWYVLANKRGPGCPDFVGAWNCPCGYLDYDETLIQAAAREVREETGVILNENNFKMVNINDDPKDSNRQNVTVRYRYVDWNGELFDQSLSNAENEDHETESIKWIPFSEISNYEWAFNHLNLIDEIFDGVSAIEISNRYLNCKGEQMIEN